MHHSKRENHKHNEVSPNQFHFKCNGHFVKLLKGNQQFFNDLRSNVGKVAICESIFVNKSGVGIIKLEKKPSQGRGWQQDAIKVLNNFFQKFLCVQEAVDDTVFKRHNWLQSSCSQCVLEWDLAKGIVIAAGPAEDVERLVKLVQEVRTRNASNPRNQTKNSRDSPRSSAQSSRKTASEPMENKRICIFYNVGERNILLFVKNHVSVYRQLEQFCRPFGQLELDIEHSKVNVFRSKRFDDDIRVACCETIRTFLQQFSFKSCFYPVAKLHALHARHPELFTPRRDSEVRVICLFNDQGEVNIYGYKVDVVKRAERIDFHLSQMDMPGQREPGRAGRRELRLFVYEKPYEDFKDILKFVLKNAIATNELRKCVSSIARYEAFPNDATPMGLNLHVHNPQITNLEINTKMNSFFSMFSLVEKPFDPDRLQAAKERSQSSFTIGPNAFVRWSGYRQATATIVGLREDVTSALLRIEAAVGASDAGDPGQSQAACFVYQKPSQDFKDILKFVLTAHDETTKLRLVVKGLARYEAFPNIRSPEGLKLTPAPQADTSSFHSTIGPLMKGFFSEYCCTNKVYDAELLTKAKLKFWNQFERLKEGGVFLIWSNDSIRIVGLDEKVNAAAQAVDGILLQDRGQSTPKEDESRCFIYQKSSQDFREILKFVLTSRDEAQKLRQAVKGIARYEAFPDIQTPVGLKLHPTPQSDSPMYYQVIGPIVKTFFNKYDCKILSHDEESLSYAKRFPLSKDGIFVLWSSSTVKIVGLTASVKSAASIIDGAVRVFKQKRGGSSADVKSTKSTESSSSKSMKYNPKKKYEEDFLFVMKRKALKNKLDQFCSEFCKITGSNSPYNLKPLGEQEIGPALMSKAIKHIEQFLARLVEERVEFNDDMSSLSAETKPQWFIDLLKDTRASVSISFQDHAILVKGLAEDVEPCVAVIKTNQQKVVNTKMKPCPRSLCRILINCDVIDQLNRKFAGKVEVSCSLEDETVEFKGDDLYIQAAEDEILSMNLIERTPELTELKLELLKTVLTKQRSKSEDLIYASFSENVIKGAVVMRNDQVILVAADGKDFTQGCRLLENIIHMNLVSIPSTSTSDLQRQTLKDLVRDISEYKDMIVTEKDNIMWVVGLIEEDVDRTTALLKNFFKHSKSVTLSYPCDSDIAQHVSKFSASDDQFPSSVNVNIARFGVQLVGPSHEAEAALQYLKNTSFLRKNVSFSEIGLAKHITSDAWKAFVNLLGNQVRCSVAVQQVTDGTAQKSSRTKRRASNKAQASNSCVTKLAGIPVKLYQGDITSEDVDVIVSGCTADFNLSKGPLSKAVLQKAGKELQTECRSSPLIQTPVIRVTRGMKLKCKYIAHLVTPRSIDEYAKRIKTALDYAEVLGAKTVAVPTLGGGRVGLDNVSIATEMVRAFELFTNEKPSCVKEIRIVVFDPNLVPIIKKRLVPNYDVDEDLFSVKLETLKEQCKSSSMKDAVDLSLIYERENTYLLAKQTIQDHVQKVSSQREISDARVTKLGANDLIDLYQAAVSCSVSIEINEKLSKLTISGLTDNVRTVNDRVKDIFYEIQEAETLSKQTIWRWTRSSVDFIDLPLRVSAAIEKEFKLNPQNSFAVPLYGEPMQVRLLTLDYNYNNFHGKLKGVLVSGETGTPPEWSSMGGSSWKRVSLTPLSPEYNSVLKQFKKSNPQYEQVLQVERIQNPALYQQYAIKKNDVERHMTSSEPVERKLFHGTSEVDAKKICAHGFDRGFAGKNATVYGKGSYFAVNSSYSANYAEREGGLAYMFLARVLTGDYCIGKSSYKAPPVKDSSDNRLYDSVVDDIYNPNIFVVFKDSSVYPSYLITFL